MYLGCDNVSEGLVISDDSNDTEVDLENKVANGNQFVWVPVEDMSIFKRVAGYYLETLQKDIMLACIEPYTLSKTEQKEYDFMKESIKANKGFYIGRYETGKDSNGNVVVKKGFSTYITKWGNDMNNPTEGAVTLARNFAKEKADLSLTSTLCYGIQWDATMQFLDGNYMDGNCSEGSYIKKDKDKGNYVGGNTNTITGLNNNYCVKNIYDMGGNVWEWTMETYQDSATRIIRGGSNKRRW